MFLTPHSRVQPDDDSKSPKLVFSGPPAISRKTGADKRTSSFIFGNKSAASVKRKLWKRGHQFG